jgi:hypothetical protein
MASTPARRTYLTLTLLLTTACAGRSVMGGPAEAAERARRAAVALDREDFPAAHVDLFWLASRCDTGAHRLRALLLLSSSGLDPANPMFSPPEAAHAAAAYLLAPDGDDDQRPVARALYRLAVDIGGLEGRPSAHEEGGSATAAPFDCMEGDEEEDRPLPALPGTSPTPLRLLQTSAESDPDSMSALKAEADSLRAELDRITSLLREGAAPAVAGNGGSG